MKKLILSLSFALLGITSLFAAKACSGIVQIALADGTEVSARLYGDEHFHYYMMLDGTPLKKNAEGKYVVSTKDELQARRRLTTRATSNESSIGLGIGSTRATGIGSDTPSYFPHTGSPKALVILVQFQDVKFKSADPVATFNHYLNAGMEEEAPAADAAIYSTDPSATNYGSVKQYFTDMSMGQFTPQFDVVGPVTMSQNSAYYGKDLSDTDYRYRQMISEACTLIAQGKVDLLTAQGKVGNQIAQSQASSKLNFADYDSDGDGYVDLVYIIYAGYSQSWGDNSDDCLWPKSGTATFFKYDANGNQTGQILKLDGKYISRFGINNELNQTPADKDSEGRDYLNGIGLFCHEFSHTLGFPDLYDTNGDYNDQCPDYWDLMDGGEYTNNGYCPTPYSPWEKEMMGWSAPITLAANEPQQLTLEPYNENSKSYKIEAERNGEYLLLENIPSTGWYQHLYGDGMLVWRIDYADKSYVNLLDFPNNTLGKPRVMIVPADGQQLYSLLCGNGDNSPTMEEWETSMRNDLFPAYGIGENGKDIDCLTSVKLNHSTLTTRPLYNIKKDEATGIVTFDYLKDFSATGIENALIAPGADNRPIEYFDLEGRKIAHPQKGHLYVTNKGKKLIY